MMSEQEIYRSFVNVHQAIHGDGIPMPERKSLIRSCAHALTQLWRDLEEEERAGRKALA